MDPNQLPLEPLITPNQVSAWPLAPIWWIGAILVLIICIFLIWLFKKIQYNKAKNKVRNLAKNLILNQPMPYQQPAQDWLQQLNRYLKQVALNDYPNRVEASLSGEKWLAFLIETAPKVNQSALKTLIEGQYQPSLYLDDQTINDINQAVLTWIGDHHV